MRTEKSTIITGERSSNSIGKNCLLPLIIFPLFITGMLFTAGCRNNEKNSSKTNNSSDTLRTEYVKVADNISYDVIIKPEPESDPWEFEKLEGLKDSILIDRLFSDVYEGRANAFDFFTGEPVNKKDLQKLEEEFNNDRSLIAKLQFTEDWYLNNETGEITKNIRSVTAGYGITDFDGRRMGYKAAFKIIYPANR